MNAQILYATMSGHSRKLAEAIAKKTGAPLHDLKTQPKLPPCDLLFIVSGIYGGESKAELLAYVKDLPVGTAKRIVLLTSSTRKTAQGTLRQTLTQAGHQVETEEYLCQGGFLFMAWGHPNQEEVGQAAAFAEKWMTQ